MFVAMGLSALFPVLHGLGLYGIQRMKQQIGLSWLVLQGFLYVLGAGIYAVCIITRCAALRTEYVANILIGTFAGEALSWQV